MCRTRARHDPSPAGYWRREYRCSAPSGRGRTVSRRRRPRHPWHSPERCCACRCRMRPAYHAKPPRRRPQHLCLDKGFDYQEPRLLAAEFGFTLHLRSRGEEAWAKRHAGGKARRWVVERTHSWLNRFRSILIRWAKKPANYLALLHFALAIITWRHALLGW